MKIYELLDKPEKWIQKHEARLPSGQETNPEDPDACCWCLVGAFKKCYGYNPIQGWGSDWKDTIQTQERRLRSATSPLIWPWNDAPTRTYEEVVKLCKDLDI